MLKVVSVNIEMDRHLQEVEDFLKRERPDIVCLQEVYGEDLRNFAETLGMNYAFGQMGNVKREKRVKGPSLSFGVGILSFLPIPDRAERIYYRGSSEIADKYEAILWHGDQKIPRLLLLSDFIATTHFTWSPEGKADDFQRADLKNLLAILQKKEEFVLCGDFNAPRGREIFDKIASLYKDNIPKKYTTSIDVNLHRLGDVLLGKNLMVDGIFTTSQYECQSVRLVDGISDHMAVVAEVSKNN